MLRLAHLGVRPVGNPWPLSLITTAGRHGALEDLGELILSPTASSRYFLRAELGLQQLALGLTKRFFLVKSKLQPGPHSWMCVRPGRDQARTGAGLLSGPGVFQSAGTLKAGGWAFKNAWS